MDIDPKVIEKAKEFPGGVFLKLAVNEAYIREDISKRLGGDGKSITGKFESPVCGHIVKYRLDVKSGHPHMECECGKVDV